jgi:hypothetical protein
MTEPKREQIPAITTEDMEQYVVKVLEISGKLTTREIQARAESEGVRCPDEPVRFLNRLRMKGVIKGEVSVERKGWLWWV